MEMQLLIMADENTAAVYIWLLSQHPGPSIAHFLSASDWIITVFLAPLLPPVGHWHFVAVNEKKKSWQPCACIYTHVHISIHSERRCMRSLDYPATQQHSCILSCILVWYFSTNKRVELSPCCGSSSSIRSGGIPLSLKSGPVIIGLLKSGGAGGQPEPFTLMIAISIASFPSLPSIP